MIRFAVFTVLTLMVCVTTFVDAKASTHHTIVCEDRSILISGLASEYSEKPVSMGFTEQGTVLEILASPDGNWTMIETLPSGKACLAASGEMWQETLPVSGPSNTSY